MSSPKARELWDEANRHLDLALMIRELDRDHPDYIEEYALYQRSFKEWADQVKADRQAERLLDAIRNGVADDD